MEDLLQQIDIDVSFWDDYDISDLEDIIENIGEHSDIEEVD